MNLAKRCSCNNTFGHIIPATLSLCNESLSNSTYLLHSDYRLVLQLNTWKRAQSKSGWHPVYLLWNTLTLWNLWPQWKISYHTVTHVYHLHPVLKENTLSRVVRGGKLLAGIRRRNPTPKAGDSDALCQQLISRIAPRDDWVLFFSYRTYLWNKQQVMSINLTTWFTMQYHVVGDHVVFYVMHSQIRYKHTYPASIVSWMNVS